jgi:hypothetical protein
MNDCGFDEFANYIGIPTVCVDEEKEVFAVRAFARSALIVASCSANELSNVDLLLFVFQKKIKMRELFHFYKAMTHIRLVKNVQHKVH